MQDINTGSDDFETASSQLLDALQQQRSSLLASVVDAHIGFGVLAGIEADRLAQKYGDDDDRVAMLRDRGGAVAARVDALAVEQEIATQPAEPPLADDDRAAAAKAAADKAAEEKAEADKAAAIKAAAEKAAAEKETPKPTGRGGKGEDKS
jgi:hypothetical protein